MKKLVFLLRATSFCARNTGGSLIFEPEYDRYRNCTGRQPPSPFRGIDCALVCRRKTSEMIAASVAHGPLAGA